MKIPYFSIEPMHAPIREALLDAMARVLDSGWYVLGQEVEEFEEAYARYNGTKYCIGVSNGLDALRLCLRSLGLPPGSEVIVPSNAYIACWNAVVLEGFKVVPVEPEEKSFNLDPSRIEDAITSRTRAIMPVHLFGKACRMQTIMEIAGRYGLHVIEDNAQSHGSEIEERKTGSFGHVNATSFYPTKNLGALGDGGAVTTDDEKLAGKIRLLRNYGSSRKYHNELIGTNARLDPLQAAILNVKLMYLDKWNTERREIASYYSSELSVIGDIITPQLEGSGEHVFHIYALRTDRRDALQEYLERKGVGALIHYPVPPHLQPAYAYLGYKKGDYPLAEKLSETSLSIPIWPGVEKERVVEEVMGFENVGYKS